MHLRRLLTGIALAVSMSFNIAQAGDVLDSIMSKKLIRVATDANWPPQSFINDNNEMDGFDADVAREIAKRLDVDIEFITPGWDVVTMGNWNHRWDIHVGSMTPTRKLATKLSFAAVYYYSPAAVAVHEDSKIASLSGLSGSKLGVATATTFEQYLHKGLSIDVVAAPTFQYRIDNATVRSYENSAYALDDLRLGDGIRLDAVVASVRTFLDAIKNGYPIKIVGDPVFYEPLAVATDLGDSELDQKLKQIITYMRKDGTLSSISHKWYGVDFAITP